MTVKKLLKVKDAAHRLNVSGGTIYSLCQQGLLPHVRIGVGRGAIRIDEGELDDFIERAKSGEAASAPASARSPSRGQFTELNAERLSKSWTTPRPS